MTNEESKRIIDENAAMAVVCTCNVLFTNDIVSGLALDAVEAVRKSPLCRYKTKQAVNKVEREQRKYEKTVNRVVGDKGAFFADANDMFLDDVRKHVEILYWSIKREFDKAGLEHSDTIAKLELARTMCGFACAQLDKREAELYAKDPRFKRFAIDYLRQTALLHALDEAARSFNIPCTVDLNSDDCLSAINILSIKLADADTIAKAISV